CRHLRHAVLRPRRLQRPAPEGPRDARRSGAALMESNPAPETHDAPVAPVRTRFIAVAALVAVALLAGAFALGFAPRRARLEKLARESAERDDRPRVEVEKP